MSDTLTYIVALRDNISGPLRKIGISTDQTDTQVTKLRNNVNSLNNVNLSGFTAILTKVASAVGIGALLGRTIKQGMEQEMRDTSFDVLFGADKAKKTIDDIAKYAATSPYSKGALSDAAQTMAGFNLEQDKIMPNLKRIGDISMGSSDKLMQLALVFSQISSAGKLQSQDLNQLISAGYNPLLDISNRTGKSISQLRKDMEKGLVPFSAVEQAFTDATSEGGKFYGMNDKIAKTAGGQWATTLDTLSDKLLGIYNNVIKPIILPALQSLNKFLDAPIDTIKRLTDQFPLLTTVVVGLGTTLVTYMAITKTVTGLTKAWAAVQAILNIVLALNPITLIVAGIIALIAVIVLVVNKVNGWGAAWQHVVRGMKLIFAAFVQAITAYIGTFVNGFMIGLNKIQEAWYKFKDKLGIGTHAENQQALALIQADTTERMAKIADAYKQVGILTKQAGNEFKAGWNSLSWGSKDGKGVTDTISAPTIPGSGTPKKQGNGTGGTGNDQLKNQANSIATGGTKTTNITINLKDLIGNLSINRDSFRESVSDMEDQVLDSLTRVLAMAQSNAGQ